MIIAQIIMGIIGIIIFYVFAKQVYEDIKADVKKHLLFNVEELSFNPVHTCEHMWSTRNDKTYMDKICLICKEERVTDEQS